MSGFEFKNLMNVPKNLLAPFAGTDRIVGSLTTISSEMIVAKILRNFINAPPASWTDLFFIHTISLPFLGGLTGFMDPPEPIAKGSKWIGQVQAGAQGVPAVMLAQYIWTTALGAGFHLPTFSMSDVLLTAGAKTLTRPLLFMVSGMFPKSLENQLAVLNKIVQGQNKSSNFKKSG